jgi:hypothetical protein
MGSNLCHRIDILSKILGNLIHIFRVLRTQDLELMVKTTLFHKIKTKKFYITLFYVKLVPMARSVNKDHSKFLIIQIGFIFIFLQILQVADLFKKNYQRC